MITDGRYAHHLVALLAGLLTICRSQTCQRQLYLVIQPEMGQIWDMQRPVDSQSMQVCSLSGRQI